MDRPEILDLLQQKAFWKREAQRQAVAHLLERALQGDDRARETLQEASRLPSPQQSLIEQALAVLSVTVEAVCLPPQPTEQPGPLSQARFQPQLRLEKLPTPATLSRPDPHGLWAVDRACGRLWDLTRVQPGATLQDCQPQADTFLCSQHYVIAYQDIPYQTTEVVDPTPRDYQIFDTDGKLLRIVTGDNRAQPATQDHLIVLPGPQVTLYWPHQDRLVALPYGSNASFSPRRDRLALCGHDITLVHCADGGKIARWPGRQGAPSQASGIGRVHAVWGHSHPFLCEFNELFESRWEHCFRQGDVVVRLRTENGIQARNWVDKTTVSYALATKFGIFRAVNGDRIEFVKTDNRVTRSWKASWPYADSPSIFEIPDGRFVLTADNGGLWVVDESGQDLFACPPFTNRTFLSLAVNPQIIAAVDYDGKVCLWSAGSGERLARLDSVESTQEVDLCGPYLYAGGSRGSRLWRLPVDYLLDG